MQRWLGSLLAPGGGGIHKQSVSGQKPLERAGLSHPEAKASVCFVLREAWLSSLVNWFGGWMGERML